MAPKRSSPRQLTKKGKLTQHDMNALEFIQFAETAVTHDAFNRAQDMATKLGSQETYRRLFSTFMYKNYHVMHYASRFGKIPLAQVLYSYLGVSANTRDAVGRTALHHAVYCTSAQNTSWLIQNFEATIEAKDAMGFTPLHLAILNNNHSVLEVLLAEGADTNTISPLGKAVHLAAASLNTPSFRAVIQNFNVNDVLHGCINPMVCAIYSDNIANLTALLEQGADVHECKLISKAIIADSPSTQQMVELLLTYNAHPDEFDDEMLEDLPIISAAKRNNIALVRLLASRCNPIEGVTWSVDGIISYVGSENFKEHDALRKAQRVQTLQDRMMIGLQEGNYLVSKICIQALENDMDVTEWNRKRDLCDLFVRLSLEGRKLPLDSNLLYCYAMDYKIRQDPQRMAEALNAALALDPRNTEAEQALRGGNRVAGNRGGAEGTSSSVHEEEENESDRISRRT